MAYGSLFVRGWRTASRVKSPFGSLLAVGLTSALCFQTLLNLGGVTKALPLTGIALPFLSQGGSSLATMLAMVGLLSALSGGQGGEGKRDKQ
jgi:cell division protein FtsW (lipid II flippase)